MVSNSATNNTRFGTIIRYDFPESETTDWGGVDWSTFVATSDFDGITGEMSRSDAFVENNRSFDRDGANAIWVSAFNNDDGYLSLFVTPSPGQELHLSDLTMHGWTPGDTDLVISSSLEDFDNQLSYPFASGFQEYVLDLSALGPIYEPVEIRLQSTREGWMTIEDVNPNKGWDGIKINGSVIDIPGADTLSNQTVDEDSQFLLHLDEPSFTSGQTVQTYEVTLARGASLPNWLVFDETNLTLYGTPTNEYVGSLDVYVTALNNGQTVARDTVAITVNNTNDSPEILPTLDDQYVFPDKDLNVDLSSFVRDVDVADTLSFSATLANGDALPSWLSLDTQAGVLSGTPDAASVGSLKVQMSVTDGEATISDTFEVKVITAELSVVASDYIAEEGASTAAFTIHRSGLLTETLSVDLSFSGTATSGADYEEIAQTVTFAPGQKTTTITVNPKTDGSAEGPETVVLDIVPGSDYKVLDSSASVEIRDAGYIGDGMVAPLDETFALNSLPGANLTIYLNFLGGDASASQTVAPFSQDTDRTTFTAEEKTLIQQIWGMVAEDWLPFNFNVTTEAPTQEQMWAADLDDPIYGIEMIIGYPTFNETHERAGEEGGFAVAGFGLGGIAPGGYLPGFVNWKNAESNGGTLVTANGASHELGHMLGLGHDGRDQEGYDSGDFVYQPNLIPTLATTTYSIAPTTENNTFEIIARTADDLITLNSRDLHLVYTSVDGLSLGTEVALQPFSASSSANVYTSRVVLEPGKGPANIRIALYEDASADGFTAGEFVVQPTAVPPTITEDYTADVYSIVATDTLNTFEVIVTTKDDLAKLNARDLHFVYTQSDGATLGSEIELPDFAAMPGMVNTYFTLVTLEPSEDAAMVALYRDPDSLIQGYYGGHQASTGTWAPIMGVSGWAHSTWDKGEYEGTTNPDQDDLKVIDDRRNVDYRLDDHADSAEFATTIVTLDNKHSTLFAEGIIERNTDEDWFTFEHSGGDLVLKVNPISPVHLSPNLKVGAVLYDASLNAIQVEDKYNPWLHASISQQDLAAGTYYLKIEGVGAADEMSPAYDVQNGYSEGRSGQGGYSDYGSLGKYTIESGFGTIAQFNPDQSHILDRSVPIEEIQPTSDFFGADEQGYAYWTRSDVLAGGGNGARGFWSQGWENTGTIIPDEYLALHLSPEQGTEFHLTDLSLEIWINRSANFILRSSQDNFSEEHVFAVKEGGNALVLDLSGLDPIVDATELRLHVTNDESLGPWFTVSGIDPNKVDTGIQVNGYVVSDAPTVAGLKINKSAPQNVSLNFVSSSAADKTVSIEDGKIDYSNLGTFSHVVLESSTYSADIAIADVISSLKHIVGLETLDGAALHAADVDNDDTVVIADVISQLKHIVGLETLNTFDLVDTAGGRVTEIKEAATDLQLVLNGDVDLSTSMNEGYYDII